MVNVHGSCTAIHEAAEFFGSISDHKKAGYFESLLEGCAPGSLAWAKTLADAGRHYDAAVVVQAIVVEEPLDREARAIFDSITDASIVLDIGLFQADRAGGRPGAPCPDRWAVRRSTSAWRNADSRN